MVIFQKVRMLARYASASLMSKFFLPSSTWALLAANQRPTPTPLKCTCR